MSIHCNNTTWIDERAERVYERCRVSNMVRGEVRDARCEVRGARLRGARCEVRGARCEVRGARCEVRGARCEVRGASARCEVRGARCEVRGARCEVRGARCEVRGARCEVRGARCEVRGARCSRRCKRPRIKILADSSAALSSHRNQHQRRKMTQEKIRAHPCPFGHFMDTLPESRSLGRERGVFV